MRSLDYKTLAIALGEQSSRTIACPLCGPSRSTGRKQRKHVLKVWGGVGERGDLITFNCQHCGARGSLQPDGRVTVPVYRGPKAPAHDWVSQLLKVDMLWRSYPSVARVPAVIKYLRNRGVVGCEPLWVRGVPSLSWGRDEFCAAAFGILDPGGRLVTIQYVLLTSDGRKVGLDCAKPFLPGARVIPGSAIRLAEPKERVLGIAEGVETALSATLIHGVPTWAATGEQMLRRFVPPQGLERVIIFGDNDSSGAGQKAAEVLARRLQSNLKVEICIPERVGDWNDVLMEGLSV
jgi:hypothetical protein